MPTPRGSLASPPGELGQHLDDGRIPKDQVGRHVAARRRAVDQEGGTREHRAEPPVVTRRATITSSASASVSASTGSASTPAAALAAAQYWIVTLAIWDILFSMGPGRCCPRVLVCLYK